MTNRSTNPQYTNRELDEKFDKVGQISTDNRDQLLTKMAEGFKGVHERQDKTNGNVRWAEKMIYLAIGGIGVLSIIVFPLLWALISAGKL